MGKQLRICALLCLLLCLIPLLVSCGGSSTDFEGKVKVIYYLEGGIYQNCEQPIIQFYGFDEDTDNLIVDPSTLSGREISRTGYTLEGWYTEKTGEGDNVTYSGKWDFATDKVTDQGITLYAKWKKNVTYTYEVCYRDEADQTVHVLGSYEVKEGEAFNDYYAALYGKKRYGYTAIGGLYTEDDQAWDNSFTHPGGEVDTAIRVFLHYIEGNYVLVSSPRELLANKNANLYLTGDIDFEGASFSGFGNFKGEIRGNGYTIKNFTLTYDNSKSGLISDPDLSTEGGLLCISLFSSLKGAVISDLTFADFTVDINAGFTGTNMIFVAPLAMKMESSTVTNVTVSGMTVTLSRLPSGFDKSSSLVVIEDRAVYFTPDGDTSVITNLNVSVDNQTNQE